MFFLALRHLSSRKQQTIFILLGILLGTTGYVVISAMMMGFQEFLKDQLINNDAHVKISARNEPITPASLREVFFRDEDLIHWLSPPSGRRDSQHIENPLGWIRRLEADPRVLAFVPQLNAQVIFRRAKVSVTGRIVGTDPLRQSQVTNIPSYIQEGSFSDIGQSGNRLILGTGLLEKLGARVSETVLVSVGKANPVPFKIVGSFQLGITTVDDSTAYGALRDIQRLNQTPSQISDISIRLADVTEARSLAEQYAEFTLEKVQSWDQANANFLSVFKTQDIVRNSMTIAILIVAGFGIYNILSILVNQKKREIAILRSIGFEAKDISRLFFSQGLVLGTLGGLIGLGVGFLVAAYIETIPVAPGRIGASGHMIISYSPLIYLKAFLLALGSATVASWIPARAAGKLLPIEIIRTENE
jgi:lipoprotein-releasing system permease protein